jgi:hypothetical protein
VQQPPLQPPHQMDEEEENIELSDFELTDGKEEDIFVEMENDVLREPRDDTNTWFHTWGRDSKAGIGVDAANDPNMDSYDSDNFDSLDNEEEDSKGSPVQCRRRYLEWRKKWDWSQKVEVSVGLRFANLNDFKEALQIFVVQNNFDYKYLHNEKKRVTAHCKENCPWKIHASSV